MTTTTLLIPCHNEESTIGIMVSQLKREYPQVEVIVVDNNSNDKTALVATKLGAKVIQETRVGKGYAFRSGIAEAPSKVTIVVDGDCTYNLGMIPALEKAILSGYDMVVVTRRPIHSASFPPLHKLGNRLFTFLHSKFLSSHVEDAFSGYRAFSQAFLLSFNGDAKGFDIETDLNLHASITGAKVLNLSSDYAPRMEGSKSKLSTFKDGMKILKRTISLSWRWKPYSLIFGPVISLFITSIVLLLRPILDFINTGYVFRFPSLVAGASCFLLAISLWLFASISSRLAKIEASSIRLQFTAFKSISRQN